MWGSLARGITATVRETASSAASGDLEGALRGTASVLRRVGEVVAPPLQGEEEYDDDDDYDEDEQYDDNDDDDGGSYYEEDEDGVDFEGGDDGADAAEGEEDEADQSPNLDRYRHKLGQTSDDVGGDEITNNHSMSAMKLAEDGLSTNDKNYGINDSATDDTKMEYQLAQEVEAEKVRIAAQDASERARLLAAAKEKEEEDARVRDEAERREQIRLESEAAATAAIAAAAAAEQAELERLEREQQLEHERILAEERRQHQEQIKREQQQQQEVARQLAEERRIEEERLEKERLEKERVEKRRLEQERLEKERVEKHRREQERLEKERMEAESERREQERIDRDRRLKEQQRKEEQARVQAMEAKVERVRLAAEAEAEANRVVMEKIERERVMAEQNQRHQEEAQALQKANAKDAAPAYGGEKDLAHNESVMAAAKFAEDVQTQQLVLEKINREAMDVANQLTHVEKERDQLQSSNQELHTMCEQLRSDLHRAAETISKLNERIADQEEEERIRQEQEAQRVEAEETNLVAATKLDMEMQIAHVRESMQAQITSLEKELIEERKLSVDQQHELQRRLEEATARATSSESEMKALASKKEANLAKQLQASEKAAAKAVTLLDMKDEEVQQLQQVIADSEYSIVVFVLSLC
jgi:hypothetical protein